MVHEPAYLCWLAISVTEPGPFSVSGSLASHLGFLAFIFAAASALHRVVERPWGGLAKQLEQGLARLARGPKRGKAGPEQYSLVGGWSSAPNPTETQIALEEATTTAAAAPPEVGSA